MLVREFELGIPVDESAEIAAGRHCDQSGAYR